MKPELPTAGGEMETAVKFPGRGAAFADRKVVNEGVASKITRLANASELLLA
jgi:hypothetical protein